MKCPNINSNGWKYMVDRLGEDLAYLHYFKNDDLLTKEEVDNIFENLLKQIDYRLKSVDILLSNKAKQVFDKGDKNKWSLDRILTELQIPKEQKQLIVDRGHRVLNNNDARIEGEPDLREQIITDLLANYSYTIEINTAKTQQKNIDDNFAEQYGFSEIGERPWNQERENPTQYYSNLTVNEDFYKNNPDWEYKEQRITTPLITPSIKGHAQFAESNDIGWFRAWYNKKTGEVHVLEVQSDLFQKGRDKKVLSGEEDQIGADIDEAIKAIEERVKEGSFTREYADNEIKKLKGEQNSKETQFLQLLNKDNNWVTFFVKSIIQNSVKKGYEKVLFPSGDTASKVEGHDTIDDYKNNLIALEQWFKDKLPVKTERYAGVVLERDFDYKDNSDTHGELFYNEGWVFKNYSTDALVSVSESEASRILNQFGSETSKPVIYSLFTHNVIETEDQLKEELKRVETEGFGALKPVWNFYENTVTNILKKQGFNPVLITDEYGNTWNEISINESNKNIVLLQKTNFVSEIFNEDESRKKWLEKDYSKVLSKVQELNKNYNNAFEIIKTFGEKGDVRTYFSIAPKENKYTENTSSTEILKQISNSNHVLNKLADRLIPFAEKNNIKIEFVNTINSNLTKSANVKFANGLFIPSTNKILINKRGIHKGSQEVTILHEILHSLTYYNIRHNEEASKDLNRILEHIKNNHSDKISDKYALTNLDEFTVALFTDGKFIKEIMDLPPIEISKYENLLEEIFDYILSLFKIQKSETLYNQAYSIATNFLERDYNEIPVEYMEDNSIPDGITIEQYREMFPEDYGTDEQIIKVIAAINNGDLTIECKI